VGDCWAIVKKTEMARFRDKSYFKVASSKEVIEISDDDDIFDISMPRLKEAQELALIEALEAEDPFFDTAEAND